MNCRKRNVKFSYFFNRNKFRNESYVSPAVILPYAASPYLEGICLEADDYKTLK